MSWLTAVTGKAEDFLNKLDRSAADVFQVDETSPSKPVALPPDASEQVNLSFTRTKPLSSSASVPVSLSNTARFGQPASASTPKVTSKSGGLPSRAPVSSAATRQKSEEKAKDEALFDFLNSKEPSSEGKRKKATPVTSRQHSRQSSTSSRGDSVQTTDGREESATAWNSGVWNADCVDHSTSSPHQTAPEPAGTESEPDFQRSSPASFTESADIEALADAMKESPSGSVHSVPDTDTQLHSDTHMSALEMENHMLKNEVASLTQEMTAIIERAKKSQTELVKTKEKLSEYVNSTTLHDQLVQELKAREMDLHEALKAKDSQLAVLRVRLEDADRSASDQQRVLGNLQAEKNRILQDQSSASGIHSQAVDALRLKLTEMEGALAREQQALRHYQTEATERQSRLEQEQKSLAEALTAAEKRITEEKAKAAEAAGQLRTVKATLDSSQQEMAEYKEKASRILQSKERLISSLREGSGAVGATDGVSRLEYESVQQERDMLREELQKSKMTTDNLRIELQDLDVQLQQESSASQETIQSLEESLEEEKRLRGDVEQELLQLKQDLQFANDDLRTQRINFQTRISDREAEINKLRNQLTTKSMSSTSESELESRVRQLTESLIQKQTMLEALSTEKNSLSLQLERLERQYRDAENTLMRSAMNSVAVGHRDDDARHRLPTFMRAGAADTEVTRKVKHYVNTIDKISIRLGVFLRRYPMARIFVIAYMALLHLWVMVVLMTYQPETHGSEFQPQDGP